jgi:uncharacterized membrane protein YecN with MAPEG domain
MAWVGGVVLLALIEYLVFGMLVARARGKYAVPAPAVTGNVHFERTFRVQQNTLELLVAFIPATWLFGRYGSPLWASLLGLVFIVGRALYARGYISAPEKREMGFGISFVAVIALTVGALVAVVRSLLLH